MSRRHSDSIAFDRAAEYYDETRGLSEEGTRRNTEVLATELGGRGPVLEIGVGTGQMGLPLEQVGISVVGLDLSAQMMLRLIAKAGGRAPFPLVLGDATRLPFRDDAFGAAYLRWVLHLIPGWRACVAEMRRSVRPGGVILTNLGGLNGGPRNEIRDRFQELTGVPTEPVGLGWAAHDLLDEEMSGLGASVRELPRFTERERDDLESYLRAVEANRFSWTWQVEEARRAPALGELRRWAEDRYGPLDRAAPEVYEVVWRAYDLPD